MSDPVLVTYTSLTCPHCSKLKAIWDKDVLPALKEAQPSLRFVTVTARNNTGVFNENIFPKKIIDYAHWFPMIFLVPGHVWDTAMKTMNSDAPTDVKEGVVIMNGLRAPGSLKIQYVQKYNILKSSDHVKWIKEALENEEFKKVQNVKKVEPKPEIKPIPSLITNINKSLTPIPTFDSTFPSISTGSEVCSMKIISRRR
jgi:hypothetical protein